MSRNLSPLRYPGGKAKLYRFLSFIIKNNSPIDTYIEPYAGGAGAALALLMNRVVKKIVLNDSDEFIFKFWHSIVNKNQLFQKKILNTPITIEEYQKHKIIFKNIKKLKLVSDLEIGFTAFYLNRCNRSGIFKSGPIGGYNQEGNWKIDARFNKLDLIRRLEHIYDFREFIDIYNYDAIDFLRNKLSRLNIDPEKTLVYLDPPYYEHGCELYPNYYKHKDHIALQEFLKNDLKIKWILSYDDTDEIRKLYQDIRKNGIVVNHFAYKAKIGKELIIISDNCLMPEDYEK